ncbi:MAG: transposase [Spirochaetota bacterium]|nr:transposase [Spirochaetota bacterium]
MRKKREKYSGATYHVTGKANYGEFIFENDYFKELFLEDLHRAKKKYPFRLKHYSIMSNHIHLLLKPESGTDISVLMQWILSVFAKQFNLIIKKKGHVWYDRFKSRIVRDINQFIATFNYISNNPVKAGMCEKAEDYYYSALQMIKENRHDLVDPPGLPLELLYV